MLKIIADEDRWIKPEWIQFYDEMPTDRREYKYSIMGAGLAISEKAHADFTAIVVGHVVCERV